MENEPTLFLFKSDLKVSALNQKVNAAFQPRIGFPSFRYRFEALIERGFNFVVFLSKSLLASNPKGLKISSFSLKGPTTL